MTTTARCRDVTHSPEDAARRIADLVIANLLASPRGRRLPASTVATYRNRVYMRSLHTLQDLGA